MAGGGDGDVDGIFFLGLYLRGPASRSSSVSSGSGCGVAACGFFFPPPMRPSFLPFLGDV